MKNDKIKVSGIVLEIAGKEITISVEEARALRDQLNQALGSPTTYPLPIYIHPDPQPRPVVPWEQPIVTWHTTAPSHLPTTIIG